MQSYCEWPNCRRGLLLDGIAEALVSLRQKGVPAEVCMLVMKADGTCCDARARLHSQRDKSVRKGGLLLMVGDAKSP